MVTVNFPETLETKSISSQKPIGIENNEIKQECKVKKIKVECKQCYVLFAIAFNLFIGQTMGEAFGVSAFLATAVLVIWVARKHRGFATQTLSATSKLLVRVTFVLMVLSVVAPHASRWLWRECLWTFARQVWFGALVASVPFIFAGATTVVLYTIYYTTTYVARRLHASHIVVRAAQLCLLCVRHCVHHITSHRLTPVVVWLLVGVLGIGAIKAMHQFSWLHQTFRLLLRLIVLLFAWRHLPRIAAHANRSQSVTFEQVHVAVLCVALFVYIYSASTLGLFNLFWLTSPIVHRFTNSIKTEIVK